MKRNNLRSVNLLGMAVMSASLFFASCSEDTEDVPSVTQEISKVETSWNQSTPKLEEVITGTKTELVASQGYVESLYQGHKLKIQEFQQKLAKNARVIYDGWDIGVIPSADQCPATSEKITFIMDNEDKNAATRWVSVPGATTWYGSWALGNFSGSTFVNDNVNGRNSKLVFCRVDGRLLNENGQTAALDRGSWYGVLKLGYRNLPTAYSKIIVRSFDNEDNSNKNNRFGDINSPVNVSDRNTRLTFFLNPVQHSGVGDYFPDYGFSYGVLGVGPNSAKMSIDDEDSSNANWISADGISSTGSVWRDLAFNPSPLNAAVAAWTIFTKGSDYTVTAGPIVAGRNTDITIARVR